MACCLMTGNGLLPEWLIADLSSNEFCGIYLRAISQEVPTNLICNMSSEITLLKLLPHLPGTNELYLQYCLSSKQTNIT